MCGHDHNHDYCGVENSSEDAGLLNRRRLVQALAAGGVLTVAGPTLSGCATNPETNSRQMILVSSSQLSQMAAASWAETKQKTPVSTDPRYTSRLKTIGARIAQSSGRADQPWDYAVFDTETKNAFVLPGNQVGFYRGMMDFTDNDDQIAAIMGHEVGHVSGKHAAERVSQQMMGQVGITAATILGSSQMQSSCQRNARSQQEYYNCMNQAQRNTDMLQAALGMGFTVGVLLPYSRKQELQSDLLGAKYMSKAGYDPHQAVRLWEKMAENSSSRQPSFLSTHPDPGYRAQNLHDYITCQERLGSQGWQSIDMKACQA